MPKINISLDIRNDQFGNGPDGNYTKVQGSNGHDYWYLYSGGSDGRGKAEVSAPNTDIEVTLVSGDSRYSISDATVTQDPSHNVTVRTKTTKKVTLRDSDANKDYTAYYEVTLSDSTAGATIPCDPEIHNKA